MAADETQAAPLPALPAERSVMVWDLNVLEVLDALAARLANSGACPGQYRGKPDDCFVAIEHGLRLGWGLMQSVQMIHVIGGKPTMAAQGMLDLILRAGHRVVWEESDAETAVVTGIRASGDSLTVSWTIDDAKTAGLAFVDKKGNPTPWALYPRAMLRWRAVSELARAHFADCLSGISYIPEELGAVVDDQGAPLIDVYAEEVEKADPAPKPPRAGSREAHRQTLIGHWRGTFGGELGPVLDAVNHARAAEEAEPLDELTKETLSGCSAEVLSTAAGLCDRAKTEAETHGISAIQRLDSVLAGVLPDEPF